MTEDKLLDLLIDLSYEVRDLMEAQCGNSGLNWHDRFMANVKEITLANNTSNEAK